MNITYACILFMLHRTLTSTQKHCWHHILAFSTNLSHWRVATNNRGEQEKWGWVHLSWRYYLCDIYLHVLWIHVIAFSVNIPVWSPKKSSAGVEGVTVIHVFMYLPVICHPLMQTFTAEWKSKFETVIIIVIKYRKVLLCFSPEPQVETARKQSHVSCIAC